MRKRLTNRNQKEFWRWILIFCLHVIFIRIDWQDYLIGLLWEHAKSLGKALVYFFWQLSEIPIYWTYF
jgi:hypothetical protein